MARKKTYDCVACGRCCFHDHNYVQMYEEDLVQLGPKRVQRYVVPNTLPPDKWRPGENDTTLFMKMEGGHCAALHVEPGRFTCDIYEDRPLLCRLFEPGSPPCLAARKQSLPGLPPLD